MPSGTERSPSSINFNDLGQGLGRACLSVPSSWWRHFCLVLLVLIISFSLSEVFWLKMTSAEVREPRAQAAPVNLAYTKAVTGKGGSVNIAALKSINVFSEVRPAAIKSTPVLELKAPVSKTKLKLTLKGVMQSEIPTAGGAIIAHGKEQAFYSVGDKLKVSGQVELVQVLADHVILENNGRHESLMLYTADEPRPAAAISAKPSKVISRSITGLKGQSVAAKANSLLNMVDFSIVREDGEIQGYRVSPRANPEKFTQAGLVSGDLVTAVNGIALSSPQSAVELLQQLRSASSAELEVRRNGETHNINITVE